jgi:TonB family protein
MSKQQNVILVSSTQILYCKERSTPVPTHSNSMCKSNESATGELFSLVRSHCPLPRTFGHTSPSPMAPSPSPRGDKNTWRDPANPIASTDPDTIPYSGTNGTTNLACIYCPTAQFSDAAVKGKVQGTVILSAVIDATGHPASISVVRPLACGLNTQAIEALKGWRLKPATDSGGNPVAVRTAIEMVFHLY